MDSDRDGWLGIQGGDYERIAAITDSSKDPVELWRKQTENKNINKKYIYIMITLLSSYYMQTIFMKKKVTLKFQPIIR